MAVLYVRLVLVEPTTPRQGHMLFCSLRSEIIKIIKRESTYMTRNTPSRSNKEGFGSCSLYFYYVPVIYVVAITNIRMTLIH